MNHGHHATVDAIETLIEPYCERLLVCRPHEVVYVALNEDAANSANTILCANGYSSMLINDPAHIWVIRVEI